jgi:two-component system sensor histidine kinase KdpD
LAIAKGFADALGIGIAAANHPEGGGAFTLTIPDKLVVAMAD